VFFACCLVVLAQLGSGTIAGVVRDATQSPVPRAKVRVTNSESGVSTDVLTNDTGAYRANSILPGVYNVQATAPGFEVVVRRNVTVSTAQTVVLDVVIEVGASIVDHDDGLRIAGR